MKEINKKVAELYYKRREAIDKDFIDFLSGLAKDDDKEFDEIYKYCEKYEGTRFTKMYKYASAKMSN